MVSIKLSNGGQCKSLQQISYRFKDVFFFMFLWLFTLICQSSFAGRKLPLETIKLLPGFEINDFAARVLNSLSMSLSPHGTLFVGTHRAGNVYAISDHNRNNIADEVITIAKVLNMPNGVAFRNGSLYIAEVNRILRYDNIEDHLNDPPEATIVNNSFPRDRDHGWKLIRFGPDGKLYVPVEAPCNVCEQTDKRYTSIMRMNPDGIDLKIFARGIRNTVGFDWHPHTKELWFTDNGCDWMGLASERKGIGTTC